MTNKNEDIESPKFQTVVKISGKGSNSNAFSIMHKVSMGLKHAGATKEEIEQYYKESKLSDYDNLLRVAHKWVTVK